MRKKFAFLALTLVVALPAVLLAGSMAGQAQEALEYSSPVNSPTDVSSIAWVISGGDVDAIKVGFVAPPGPCGR